MPRAPRGHSRLPSDSRKRDGTQNGKRQTQIENLQTQEKSEAARGAVTACVSAGQLQLDNRAGGSADDGALILQHDGPCAAAGLLPRSRGIF